MYILPGNADARHRFVQQRDRARQQSYHRRTTLRGMCQYLVIYFVALLFTPAMAIFNIVMYTTHATLRKEMEAGINQGCENAMTSIEGYLVLYVLMCGFWIAYAIFHSPLCAMEIRFATWNRTLYRLVLVLGIVLLLGMVAFTLAASYWATEANFRDECRARSSHLLNSVIANVVLSHVVFDLICFALFPVLFEMYQWL